MKSRRRALAIVLLLATCLLVAAVAAFFLYPRLPHPSVANREQLIRWLVLRDLGKETLETRQVLARRLEEEFRGSSGDWQALLRRLNEAQRQRMWSNLLLVLEPWFLDKVEEYARLNEEDRSAYADQFLDRLDRFRGAAALRREPAQPEGEPAATGGFAPILLGQVTGWRERAEPEQQERMDEFLCALRTRWAIRQVTRLLPVLK